MTTLLYIALGWTAIAAFVAVVLGKSIKLADQVEGTTDERCCDGEFCGAWDSCREVHREETSPVG